MTLSTVGGSASLPQHWVLTMLIKRTFAGWGLLPDGAGLRRARTRHSMVGMHSDTVSQRSDTVSQRRSVEARASHQSTVDMEFRACRHAHLSDTINTPPAVRIQRGTTKAVRCRTAGTSLQPKLGRDTGHRDSPRERHCTHTRTHATRHTGQRRRVNQKH